MLIKNPPPADPVGSSEVQKHYCYFLSPLSIYLDLVSRAAALSSH